VERDLGLGKPWSVVDDDGWECCYAWGNAVEGGLVMYVVTWATYSHFRSGFAVEI
jgi:hypothetical protein